MRDWTSREVSVLLSIFLFLTIVAAIAMFGIGTQYGQTYKTFTIMTTNYVTSTVNSTFYDHATSTIFTNTTTITITANTTLANTTITVTLTEFNST